MSIFSKNNSHKPHDPSSDWAEMVVKTIHDGVVVTSKSGVVEFVNPAAVAMTECGSADKATGLDYGLLIKIESKEGREFTDAENLLIRSMQNGEPLENFQACLIASRSGKRLPVAISVLSADGKSDDRVIILRDIAKELIEEGEQAEFVSTASHEMRTPVATIDGYISLTLNPQTATIDDRARGYLNSAHAASQHLGKLFQDLLDVTKLDDGRIRPHFEPADMVGLVRNISDDYLPRAKDSKINFTFGANKAANPMGGLRMSQVVYGYVDINFMREIMDNLIDNALKYTPSGGSVYVNVRGDGDKVLINVTDTGIGISAEDLAHIFQKFYRADNSDTRTIGGTGLGLYLVKQRVEAMGGKVWAESSFGEGSTFYVSLPRISSDEYEKRMIAVRNQSAQPPRLAQPPAAPTPLQPTTPVPASSPATPKPPQPAVSAPPAPAPMPPAQQPQPLQPAMHSPAPATSPQPPAPPYQSPAPPGQSRYSQYLRPQSPSLPPKSINSNNLKGAQQ